MCKVNIVNSQAVFEMSSFGTDTRSKSSSPLVNNLVKNRLFKTAPDINTIDLSLGDTTLHDSRDFVIQRNEI